MENEFPKMIKLTTKGDTSITTPMVIMAMDGYACSVSSQWRVGDTLYATICRFYYNEEPFIINKAKIYSPIKP